MSVPVGAFASKSRPITAVNWSSVSRTEKSRSPRKLAGNTRRPCRLTTNGFTLSPPEPYLLRYPECAGYAPGRERLPRDLWPRQPDVGPGGFPQGAHGHPHARPGRVHRRPEPEAAAALATGETLPVTRLAVVLLPGVALVRPAPPAADQRSVPARFRGPGGAPRPGAGDRQGADGHEAVRHGRHDLGGLVRAHVGAVDRVAGH